MKAMTLAVFLAATCVAIPAAYAQQVQTTPADVAKPGGKIPGARKLALVKVADGFHDPVGVTAANDGSGRIFVVERAGLVKGPASQSPDPINRENHVQLRAARDFFNSLLAACIGEFTGLQVDLRLD